MGRLALALTVLFAGSVDAGAFVVRTLNPDGTLTTDNITLKVIDSEDKTQSTFESDTGCFTPFTLDAKLLPASKVVRFEFARPSGAKMIVVGIAAVFAGVVRLDIEVPLK